MLLIRNWGFIRATAQALYALKHMETSDSAEKKEEQKEESAKTAPEENPRENSGGSAAGGSREEFKLNGEDLLRKVKELIKSGNARRIIIKNEAGSTIVEIPLTIGAIGAVIAPALAAVGALAALLTKCTIVVEKRL
jgi:hypothetical protein